MGKRGLKNLLIGVIVLGMVMVSLQSSAWAIKVSAPQDATSINHSDAVFEMARDNRKYSSKNEVISGGIAKAYQQDVFHYECQETGYYHVYTVGMDTVGAVYEEENNWRGQVTEYKFRGQSDDQYSGFGSFGLVLRLDKNEDYFACVRGYNNKVGSYALKIEPNEDVVQHKKSGVWEADYVPFGPLNSGMWISKKVYLTKEQTIFYYMSIDPKNRTLSNGSQTYTISQLKQKFKKGGEDKQTAVNFILTSLCAAIGVASTGNLTGVTASFIGFVLSEGVGAYAKAGTAEATMKRIEDVCGIHYYQVPGQPSTTRWGADSGLLATKWFTGYPEFMMDPWSYSSYNQDYMKLKGEKWYVGKWTFD